MTFPNGAVITLITESGEEFTVSGERDTVNSMDAQFSEAHIPVQLSWEDSAFEATVPLTTQHSQERGMGSENLIYGSAEFSNPDRDSDEWGSIDFDFREYPSGTFDIFEIEISGDIELVPPSEL